MGTAARCPRSSDAGAAALVEQALARKTKDVDPSRGAGPLTTDTSIEPVEHLQLVQPLQTAAELPDMDLTTKGGQRL